MYSAKLDWMTSPGMLNIVYTWAKKGRSTWR